MPSYKEVTLEVKDRVAKVILARPPLNILTMRMMKEMNQLIQRIGGMPDVCAVVLASAPSTRAFSAGVAGGGHKAQNAEQMVGGFYFIFLDLYLILEALVWLLFDHPLC